MAHFLIFSPVTLSSLLIFNIKSIGLKSTAHVSFNTHEQIYSKIWKTIIPNSFLKVLQYHLPICLSPQYNISPMRQPLDTGIFFPHWKSYKVTNSFHPYPKINNSQKCNSFMSTNVKMSTSCTAIKNMSISWRYFRNIFGSFIGHFILRLYSNLFADAEDDSVVEVAGTLHDEDSF